MDIERLQAKLIYAARVKQPEEAVPFAFERRIMARLSELASQDSTCLWERLLWKAAMVCAALSILLGAWSMQPAFDSSPVSLEAAVFSMARQLGDTW